MSILVDPSAFDAAYTVADVRRIDRAAIESAGIPGYTLMTRAAAAALEAIRRTFPEARRLCVMCGSGNNAGDGLVLARLALDAGLGVEALTLSDTGQYRGDALQAFQDLTSAGLSTRGWDPAEIPDCDVIVDALLGSGIDREVSGSFRSGIEAINASAAPVVALDLPSGLDGDRGRILGAAVRADVTVTFVALKSGLLLGAGPDMSGRVETAGLGIPRRCFDGIEPRLRSVHRSACASLLPPRHRQSHKGDFGHVLVVGGDAGMPGAALLAGYAALRAGAGRVSVATASVHAAGIAAARPELMVHAVEGPDSLAPLMASADVIALGPGLGRAPWGSSLFDAIVASATPLVIDADGLNLLAERSCPLVDAILTPHPGEAARLLASTASTVQADRLAALDALMQRYAATVVLKGAGTLVGCRGEGEWICRQGNPGMAAPGMGDVLTGVVAALRAQGLSANEAAVLGVDLHARAGDLAAAAGQRGLLASELADALPRIINA